MKIYLTYSNAVLKLVNFLVKLIPSCPKISQLEMEYGQLVSPNFPDKYPNSQDCSWVLTVPTGFYVALKFQSFEVHYNSTYITVNLIFKSVVKWSLRFHFTRTHDIGSVLI